MKRNILLISLLPIIVVSHLAFTGCVEVSYNYREPIVPPVEVVYDTVYRFDEHKFVYSENTLTIDSAYVGGNVFVSNGKKLIKE